MTCGAAAFEFHPRGIKTYMGAKDPESQDRHKTADSIRFSGAVKNIHGLSSR